MNTFMNNQRQLLTLLVILIGLPFIKILLNSMKKSEEDFQDMGNLSIKYGDTINLKIGATSVEPGSKFNDAKYITSSDYEYFNDGTSRKTIVYLYPRVNDLAYLWVIKGPAGQSEKYKLVKILKMEMLLD